MRRWGAAAAVLGAAILTLWPLAVTGATTVQQLQQERQQAVNKLDAAKTAFSQTEAAVYSTESQIANLNAALQADQAREATLRSEAAATRQRLTATAARLAATRRRLTVETGLMAGQVRLMEENGAVGYLDVVLGANSFSDLISRLYLMGQLAAMAGSLVHRIQGVERQVARRKALLARQAASLARLETQAAQEASRVTTMLGHQRILVHSLQVQESQQEQLMQARTQRIAQYTSKITALLNQYHGGYLSLHNLFTALYPLVAPIAQQFGLPTPLVIAVITEESGGDASAVSTANAIGLMQVEPGTAAAMGFPVSDLYNPQQNVVIGCTYLSDMLNLFGGSAGAASQVAPSLATPPGNSQSYLSAALAAYNAGPGAVQAYGLAGLFQKPWGVQQYVTNIESLYLQYSTWGAP
jgi:soluble lytic murein transglycosylase-like protein